MVVTCGFGLGIGFSTGPRRADYANCMNASGLPARIVYTAVALPLGGGAGFYLSIYLLPRVGARFPQLDPGVNGESFFYLALGVGSAIAFSASLLALTLPWTRHRKRRGRAWRITLSCLVVLVASVAFAAEVRGLVYDLVFAVWLAYTMAYTFVRYGVVDEGRRRRSTGCIRVVLRLRRRSAFAQDDGEFWGIGRCGMRSGGI